MANARDADFTVKVCVTFSILSALVISPYWTVEPVNIPKQIGIIFTSAISLMLLTSFRSELTTKYFRKYTFGAALFLTAMLGSSLWNSTFPTSLYGTYGRNTGILTYCSYAVIFLTIAVAISVENISIVYKWVYSFGVVNTLYALLQVAGADPVPWEIPYPSKVVGFVGNPNFEASMLAILSAFFLFEIMKDNTKKLNRVINIVLFLLNIFLIQNTQSIQGFIVLTTILLIQVSLSPKLQARKRFYFSFISASLLLGFTLLIGIFGIGPLKVLLQSASLDQRKIYWWAGIEMFGSNPLLGLGPDTFGDWFLRYKPLFWEGDNEALSNSSHNIFIDIASSSGIIALVLLIVFVISTIRIGLNAIVFHQKSLPELKVFYSMAIGYLAQSLVSINQIGLGTVFVISAAVIIGIGVKSNSKKEIFERNRVNIKAKVNMERILVSPSHIMKTYIGILLATLVCLPQVTSGVNYRSALQSGEETRIYNASISWPRDPTIMVQIADLFLQNDRTTSACNLLYLSIMEFPNSIPSLRRYLESECKGSPDSKEIQQHLTMLTSNINE